MNIKIRAWDEKNKKMVYEFGTLTGYKMMQSIDDGRLGVYSIVSGIELPVMLSTGKHDRDGREIYEGDIMGGKTVTGKPVVPSLPVIWDEADLTWKLEPQMYNGRKRGRTFSTVSNSQVVGNVYQNGDMLK